LLKDRKIGVLMGGVSAEREVSLRSGAAIYNALKGLQYNAVFVDVGADICSILQRDQIEIAFLALHGGYGENGAIQGLLDVLGVPYTGSGVLASALAMDKEASKKIFLYHHIPMPPFAVLNKEHRTERMEFDLPWVVKPSTEGSSIGVSIVKDKKDFQKAVEDAFSFGPKVIVEEYIEGQEIQVGILNNRILGGVEVRPSVEFYSYEAKYTAGLTEYILPPHLEKEVYEKAQCAALAAHEALGCQGATRVDLRVDREGNPFVLEVNTIPGMTETSLLPKIAGRAGLDFRGLIEEILRGVVDEGK
jgi:D-alanine-D-alanine ligase